MTYKHEVTFFCGDRNAVVHNFFDSEADAQAFIQSQRALMQIPKGFKEPEYLYRDWQTPALNPDTRFCAINQYGQFVFGRDNHV